MEATDTIENKPLTIEDAVQGLIAPTDEATETVEEDIQATEDEAVEATDEIAETEELTAESDTEEVEYSDEADDIELSAEDEIDNDYEEDAVPEEAPNTYEVKVDGQVKEVSLEELKQGYSGQEYVQKGMQENARLKKEVEGVYQALQSERQQVAELVEQMRTTNLVEPTAPSRELFQNDPVGYMEAKMDYDEQKAKYDQQVQKVQSVMKDQTAAEKRAQEVYIRQELDKLQKVIPEFTDPQKAQTIRNKLVTSGANYYGYTADEIGQVMDHRAIQVLHDAIRYRDIMANKNKAVQKTNKKRVVKAGAKKVDDGQSKVRQKQMAKLKQTGNIQDAVSLIMNS